MKIFDATMIDKLNQYMIQYWDWIHDSKYQTISFNRKSKQMMIELSDPFSKTRYICFTFDEVKRICFSCGSRQEGDTTVLEAFAEKAVNCTLDDEDKALHVGFYTLSDDQLHVYAAKVGIEVCD